MKVSGLAFLSILGVAEATSISGETIQHHMNKMDKLRLMKHSHRVVQGRNLEYQAYGSNNNANQNYNSNNGNNYGSWTSYQGNSKSSGSYQQNNNGNNRNGNNYNANNADNEYFTQDVNRYYFKNMRQGDFRMDGTKQIKFQRCVSLRSLNEDLDQYENMQSISDYVIFKVTDMYQKEFEFAVGISDFVESLISTIPEDREEYCQVCQQSFQTCQQQKSLNEWNSVVQNTGNIGNYYGFNNKKSENKESNMRSWGWGGTNGMGYYAQDSYANGNNRKLEQEDNVEYIDCETCESYGCFDQMYEKQKSYHSSGSNLYSQSGYRYYNNQDDAYTPYNDDQYSSSYYGNNGNRQNYQQQQQHQQQFSTPMEAALNWVSEVAQCKELKMFDSQGSSGYYTNYKSQQSNYQQGQQQNQNQNINNDDSQHQQSYNHSYSNNSFQSSLRNPYAGMMCNSDGSGMEIGIFMDQYCTIYDSSRTYKDIIKNGSPQWTYYELTKGLMEFTFTQSIDCEAKQYAQPDWNSKADYDSYQQQQQASNQYYSSAEDFYNAYYKQQNQNYQQANEYYQEESDSYYSYYMNGANVQAMDSCQQLFQQEIVQLGIPCTDNNNGQQQQNQQQQTGQAWYTQDYGNQDKPNGEFSYFSLYSGRQSYAYDLDDPFDQEEVCSVMNSKMASDSFQRNAFSQSRFKNMYNYKLYSATTNWRGFRTRIGEGIQTFRYNAGERFRSIHEEEISTKLAIISFLAVASVAIVFVISRWSAPYVAKGLEQAASHAVEHVERLAEHVKSMRSDEEASLSHAITQDSYQFNEIESFDFFEEGQAEPSGKKHKLFY